MSAIVDTCGWIEWLTDGPLAEAFAPALLRMEELIVPTLVQFELYKWVKRERGEREALEVVALTEQGRVMSFHSTLSLLAADLALHHQLAVADAIIYATARYEGAPLFTADAHFKGLPEVIYFDKRPGQGGQPSP